MVDEEEGGGGGHLPEMLVLWALRDGPRPREAIADIVGMGYDSEVVPVVDEVIGDLLSQGFIEEVEGDEGPAIGLTDRGREVVKVAMETFAKGFVRLMEEIGDGEDETEGEEGGG